MNTTTDFEEFEKLNAQIDVWIDEEEYQRVENKLTHDVDLSQCFKDQYCTNGEETDRAWNVALGKRVPTLTIDGNHVEEPWSKLFFTKAIRSKIQEKGTDCYFRRFDQLVSYLERSLPDYSNNEMDAKLAIFYLLELSAASFSYESLGFAERARRILNEEIKDESFKWFYELLSRYNIGVAYFHVARYQESVLEFNYLIFEISRTRKIAHGNDKDAKAKIDFFDSHHGDKFLHLPSVIYRADIQLKLQLAYHALKTLQLCDDDLIKKENRYKKYKADLIKIQAYQFMGELQISGDILQRLWKNLFNQDQEFPYIMHGKITHARAFDKQDSAIPINQNLKGRLLSLAVDQHLNCLRRQRGLLSNDGDRAENTRYLKEFGERSLIAYFKSVEFEDYDRNGYWEQIAEYLDWLASTTTEKTIEADGKLREEVGRIAHFFTDEISGERLSEFILQIPNEESSGHKSKKKTESTVAGRRVCSVCGFKGIKLARLKPDHYDGFRDRMVKVFKKPVRLGIDISHEKKEEFVNRLIRLERENRNDLRIRDLLLRYESQDVLKDLPPQSHKGVEDCWRGIDPDKRASFGLLPCAKGEDCDSGRACLVKGDGCSTQAHYSNLVGFLPQEHYQNVMEQWDESFVRHLKSPSKHDNQDPGLYFLGLRRWNSSSPAKGYSVGGGYLIYHLDKEESVDLGIAIDPGFDFIRNLFHMGFSLNYIDIVLISHAHIDHIRDLESIITLLFELSKREGLYRKVHIILSLAVYKRLKYIIESPDLRLHIEPYIIDINREIEANYFERLPSKETSFSFNHYVQNEANRLKPIINEKGKYYLRIRPTQAYHDDHSGYSDSFGFLLNLRLPFARRKFTKFSIGYTGDTKWVYPKIPDPIEMRANHKSRSITDVIDKSKYKKCDVLIVHLGSILKKNKENKEYTFEEYDQCINKSHTNCEDLIRNHGHPYLIGLLRTLSGLYESPRQDKLLVLVSEFGEEMRGKIRVDLIKRLRNVYGDKMDLLPVDVGINLQLKTIGKKLENPSRSNMKIWCVQCNRFVPLEEAEFEHYGVDEAIYCVCKTCSNGTPLDVLQSRLRQIQEVGYELHTARRTT